MRDSDRKPQINCSRVFQKLKKLMKTQKLRHEKRKKEILEILAPVLGNEDVNSTFVLLCWGKPDRCQILSIEISQSADDVAR